MAVRRVGLRAGLAACAASCALLACGDAPPESPPPESAPAPEARAPEPPSAAVPAPAPAPVPAPPREAALPPPPAPATISLEELGNRIKATPAIGTFSKLALKNDIDDLVDALRGYHEHEQGDLDDLHERYEALVLKLMTLLERDEPELALALGRSRDDIWSRLVNPIEFAKLPT